MSVQRLSLACWRPPALLTVSVVANYLARGTLSTAALTSSQLEILPAIEPTFAKKSTLLNRPYFDTPLTSSQWPLHPNP